MTHRWKFGAAVLAAFSGLAAAAQPDASQPSALVTLTALHEGSLPRTVESYGVVEASASARRTLVAQTTETVGAVYVHEGDEVAAGAPLVQLAPSPETVATYAQAQSALRVARALVVRTRQMLGQHLATAQELAQAQKSEDDARATLAALNAQGAGGGHVLRAPFPAIVLHLSASPGLLASPGTSLVELAKPDGLVLKVGVTPAEAALVAHGDAAQITAAGEHQGLPGTVLQRGSVVDPASGLVPVEIALPRERFFPGQSAAATVTVGETRGYVVPHAAILVNDQGNPYVVQADRMKARKVAVRIVGTDGDRDAIQGAHLDAGQPVVLSGNYQLDDGMRMRVETQAAREPK